MKLLCALLITLPVAWTQSATVTAPTANQSISGTAFTFTATISGFPAAWTAEYQVDGERACVVTGVVTGWQCVWNSTKIANGSSHGVVVVVKDALNATLATSASVLFSIANTLSYADGTATFNAALATTPSCTANCTGEISFVLAVTGSWATGKAWVWTGSIDGKPTFTDSGQSSSNPNATEKMDTRSFYDGSHVATIIGSQGGDFVVQYQQVITILNGATNPVELRLNAREIPLQPAGTFTLSTTLYNSDGSVGSSTPMFYSQNTGVATVNQSTGLVTATGSAPATVKIGAMTPTLTGTFTLSSNEIALNAGFIPAMTGDILQVTSGTGCNLGFYPVVGAGDGVAVVQSALVTTGTSCGFTIGPSQFAWVLLNSVNTIPHFSKSGSLLTAYSPTTSIWQASMFQNGSGADGQQYPTYWKDFKLAGWNTMEVEGADCLPGTVLTSGSCQTNSGQSPWQTDITNYVASWASTAATNGTYVHLINDNWWRGDTLLFNTTQGTGSAWSPTAIQYMYQTWGAQNVCTPTINQQCYGAVIGGTQYDEVNSTYGALPIAPNPFIFGTNGFTQIVATSAACVGTWPGATFNGGNNFVLHGATNTALNSVAPTVYHVTSITSTTFSFSCTGVSDGTYNASTDPGLVLERFAFQFHSSAYVTNNAFSTIMGWANAASPARPTFSWTPAAATNNAADQGWLGNSAMSDYAELYYALSPQLYSPNHASTFTLIADMGDFFRGRYGNLQDQKPWLALSEGVSVNYGFTGPPIGIGVASISGDVVTTSVPHGLYNIYPGVTRVLLSGTSSGTFNHGFYIRSAQDQMHFQIYIPSAALSAGAGTMTFSNGDAYAFSDIQNISPPIFDTNANPASGCVISNHRGLNFVISGTGTAWDGTTNYYPYNNQNQGAGCSGALSGAFYSVPSGSATGGTASIIPDNYFLRGRSIGSFETGAQYVYASHMYPAILGAAGTRTYNAGVDQQGPQPPTSTTVIGSYNPSSGAYSAQVVSNNGQFNNYTSFANGTAIQQGPFPLMNNGGSADSWYAGALSNRIIVRILKYLLQPRLASPDYGNRFQATARSGTYGKILVIQNFLNTPQALAGVSLSPYLAAGQPLLRLLCDYSDCATSIIAPGTTSDSPTINGSGTAIYIFPTTFSSEYHQPGFSAKIADVPSATAVVFQYAYSPWTFSTGIPLSVNCGSGSACQLPVDLSVGPVYYRAAYLNSSNTVVGVSAIQTLQ